MRFAALVFGFCLCCASPAVAQTPPSDAAQVKREHDLKMPEIVRAMGLKEGSRAADIGAGDGDYEPALARSVGAAGRIYAEDISEGAIKRLHKLVDESHLANVEVIHGSADDPKLPEHALDAVLMVIAYHEVADHEAMMKHVMAALHPGGRLVIVDMAPHKTQARPRADQTKIHVIAPDIVEAEGRAAGFDVVSRDDRFIDNPDEESTRWMIVFRKPQR
jgi:ubiquinone/menaquinone biosynthesis C-methylase UbiE